MSSIDKRIVQMQFDNHGFESGVSKTLSSLERLNNSLKMKGASKGLSEVDRGIKSLSSSGLSGLSSGVGNLTSGFSNLGIVGATALVNLTNSAVNAGKRITKALTIEPVTTGFQEYETKMNAIKTILTNTSHEGTTLKDVTSSLDELNKYADDTIYNFAQMTENIGRFTAAGVGLKDSTAAIKGIANLAAASGSNPYQASSAMYQLSQALAAGRVNLMDWNSVVNAGMGGKFFQDALIRTSEVMGTGAEAMIEKYGSFRESLSQGEWLTTDVLLETLKQIAGEYTEAELKAQGYSDAQAKAIVKMGESATSAATEVKTISGMFDAMKESVQSSWAETWEHIIGDSEEATKTLTAVKDAFDKLIKPSSEARNNMLKTWNELGGREDVIKGVSNIVGTLGKALGPIGEAWKEVFPPMTGERLKEITEGFKNLTENFKISDSTAGKIKNTFKGVFSVINLLKNGVTTLVKSLSPVLSIFGGVGSVILTVTSCIGSFISKIDEAATKSNIFGKISDGIKSSFEFMEKFISSAGKAIGEFFSSLGKFDFKSSLGFIGDAFKGFGEAFGSIFSGIGSAIGDFNFDTIFGALKALLGAKLVTSLSKLFKPVEEIGDIFTQLKNSFKGAVKSIKGILDGVRGSLEAYQNSINAGTLMKIAGAIAILAGALAVLASIDAVKLDGALTGITVLFMELVAAMAVLIKLSSGSKITGLFKISTGLLLLSTAMLVLSGAVKSLSGLDWEQLAKGLTGVAGMVVILTAASKLMSGSSKGLIKTSAGLIVLSLALRSMVGVIKELGKLDANALMTGLVGIGALLAELGVFMKLTDLNKMGIGKSVGLLVLAGALKVLADVVKSLGKLDANSLVTGLVGIGAVLTELGVFMTIVGKSGGGMIATAVGLTILAGAMNIMAAAVKSFGEMTWEEVGIGLTSMAGALVLVGAAVALMPKGVMLATAVGLAAMSGALLILGEALKSLGGQSWQEVAISLVSLAGSLTILAMAMAAMTGGLAGAAAMLVMSAALAIFIPHLISLSQLSLEQVGTGLLALAGAFAVLGVAALMLTPVVPSLFGLAGAIALLGVACLAIGGGLLAFGTGLSLVAASGGAAGAVLIGIIKELLNLLPMLGTKLGEAFGTFAEAIGQEMPKIVDAIGQLILGILTALRDNIPEIVTVAAELITAFAEAVGKGVPRLVEVGVTMILNILTGISQNIGRIIDAGVTAIVNFINGVSQNIGRIIDAGINLAVNFINGVANGLTSNQGVITGAVSNLISALLSTGVSVLLGGLGSFISAGVQLITGVATGIANGVGKVISIASSIPGKMAAAVRSGVGSLVSAGASLMSGLASGIASAVGSAIQAAKNAAGSVISAAKSAFKINSPSKVFIEIGKSTNEGLAKGITKYASMVDKPLQNVVARTTEAVSKPLSMIANLVDQDIDASPVIAPVLDLSNIESGSRTIGSLINSNNTLALNAEATGLMTKSIGQIQNGTDNSDVISALKDLKKELANTNNVTYAINGVTYDDGSNVVNAVETIVRAAKIERRI